jgi:hypothetical protein
MHAKTLIVDDEIAIIGSANLNQRSFTYDSETSVVVFNDGESKKNFAATFRRKTWTDFLRVKSNAPGPGELDTFAAQGLLPAIVQNAPTHNAFILYSAFVKDSSDQEDLDDRIINYLSNMTVNGFKVSFPTGTLSLSAGDKKILDKFVISEDSIHEIFDTLWENIIDPDGNA